MFSGGLFYSETLVMQVLSNSKKHKFYLSYYYGVREMRFQGPFLDDGVTIGGLD